MKRVSINIPFKDGKGYETKSSWVAETPEEQLELDQMISDKGKIHRDYINGVWGDKSYYKGAI